MKILFLADRLSARGGADRWLLDVLAGLRDRTETVLAVGFDDGSLPRTELDRLGPWLRIKGLERRGLKPKGLATVVRRLRRAFGRFNPDLTVVNNLMDPDLFRVVADHGPAVLVVQDHRLFCPGLGKLTLDGELCTEVMGPACQACFHDRDYGTRLINLTQGRLERAKLFDRVVVLSNYMADQLVEAGLDRGRIRVIPPFIGRLPEVTPSRPGDYHFLAGRLVSRKGILVALAAAQRLTHRLPLVIAGDGRLKDKLTAWSAEHSGLIELVGWAGRSRMAELLARARTVWVPSLWAEPFGIIGIEAMAAAKPVVAAPVGGVTDWLVPGRTGLAVPPGDPDALARAADRLAEDKDLAAALGRAGRKRYLTEFNREAILNRLTDLFDQAVAAQPACPGNR